MLSFTPHQYLPLVKAGMKKTPSEETLHEEQEKAERKK